jgi:hypothetical protein
MPVVPVSYRADNHFEPQTKIKDTDRVDFAASAGLLTGEIIRVGHWVIVVADGVDRPATGTEYPNAALNANVAFPSWVEWDFDEVVGFPDANRLDQITCLVGPHRAKTIFYARATAGVLLVPVAGDLLTVGPAAAADVTAINAAAGGSTVCAVRDGILTARSAATVTPVAKCLSVSGGVLEYVTA